MNSRTILLRRALLLLIFSAAALPATLALHAGPTKKSAKSTRVSEQNDLRILKLSGTPRERGLKHGKKFAREILKLMDAFIKAEHLSGGARQYERNLTRILHVMTIPPLFRDELEGLFEGIRAATKGKMKIPALKRNMKLEDVIAMNCIPDSAGFGCSSFAAWGAMTQRGDTIVARNLDWNYIPQLAKHQVVIVQMPDPENKRLGWASVTWPGQIGCFTGMNQEGVTVCMHDVDSGPPRQQSGFTPRSLILRETIECARADTAQRDVLNVLKDHDVAVGNNIPVGAPYRDLSKETPFTVFEYDGRSSVGGGPAPLNEGARLRRAGDSMNGSAANRAAPFQIATNHYRNRGGALEKCHRYDTMNQSLLAREESSRPLTAADAQRLLGEVDVVPRGAKSGILTYHSVVFEPNRRTLQVAFCNGKRPAPESKWNSLNLNQWFD